MKKELEIQIQTMRIYSQYIGMEFWHRKMCPAVNKKWEKRNNGKIEVPNQESIRMLGEKGI